MTTKKLSNVLLEILKNSLDRDKLVEIRKFSPTRYGREHIAKYDGEQSSART